MYILFFRKRTSFRYVHRYCWDAVWSWCVMGMFAGTVVGGGHVPPLLIGFFPLFNFVLVSLLCPCPTSAYPLHSQNRSFAPDGGLIDNNLDVNIHKDGRLTITTVVYYHHHYHCHHYCCYCCCCQCCCYVEMLTSIWNRPNRPTSINVYIADVWICTPNLVSVHKSFTWGRCNTEVTARSADFRCTLWTRCDVL